jgi:hypothetical protein
VEDLVGRHSRKLPKSSGSGRLAPEVLPSVGDHGAGVRSTDGGQPLRQRHDLSSRVVSILCLFA